jgi:hypothetical protein
VPLPPILEACTRSRGRARGARNHAASTAASAATPRHATGKDGTGRRGRRRQRRLHRGPAGVGPGDDPEQQKATALPAPISLAASFDTALAYSYGALTGREAADLGANVVEGPDVNIIRVPQGGRTFESLSEDPYLTAAIGTAQAQGIQATPGMPSPASRSAPTSRSPARSANRVTAVPR